MTILQWLVPLAATFSAVSGMTVDITSIDSVRTATSSLAYDMMTYYSGNQTGNVPGILPGPCESDTCYYWWEAGAMWSALINYAQYTGDTSYQDVVLQSLEFQVGPDYNYNPPNQSKNMGIDDQDFWGFAAMEAAEAGIPDSTTENMPSWVALAQAVWNFQVGLWDTQTCGGGFRWQVYSFNNGYNLKNTISNGGFFQLSARLARYTNNQTYVDWAEKVWDWMEASPLFATQDNQLYLWDNTDADTNCTKIENYVWTYNYGTLMVGAAYLYNMTNGSDTWGGRVQQIWQGASTLFYKNNVMFEYLCEDAKNCDNDQSSFKAYLARWSAVTMTLAPFMWGQIMPQLQASANGAAGQCVGGNNGRMCGRQWYSTTWDGSSGVGQQMAALAVIGATQMTYDMAPKSLNTGGTSKSDPNAGNQASGTTPEDYFKKHPITTADKAGAGILTVLMIVSVVGLCIWLVL